jgi:hypothetical protein
MVPFKPRLGWQHLRLNMAGEQVIDTSRGKRLQLEGPAGAKALV